MATNKNGSFDTAQNLGVLSKTKTISGALDRTNKVDYFRFRVTSRSSFQGALDRLKSNANLTLFNSDRQQISFSGKSGQKSEAIASPLKRGSYFLKIDRRSGETQYRLKLAGSLLQAPDPTTAKFTGLSDGNTLVFFNSDNLSNVTQIGVKGLQSGENLLGIDYRPNTGQLFGLGSTSRLYSIDPATGTATQVGTGQFAVPLNGTSFGVDFNPVADRVRVVSDAGQNLRLNPDTGVLVDGDAVTPGVQADGNLNGATTSLVATAYTNSFKGTTTTAEFGINAATDQLFSQNPFNAGTQTLVGALGVDFSANAGLDITFSNGVNQAFAASNTSLYSINLTTGAATLVGSVKDIVTPIALTGLAARA